MAEVMFKKFDGNKLLWNLLPLDAVQAIIRVLMYGAKKYSPDNWCKGADWSRYYNAAMRHLSAWWQREDSDTETNMSHLWHAGCCILFLIAYEIRHLGTDDRPSIAAMNFKQENTHETVENHSKVGTMWSRNTSANSSPDWSRRGVSRHKAQQTRGGNSNLRSRHMHMQIMRTYECPQD